MRCYECAKADQIEEAVALCRSCSAGLWLAHLREKAHSFAVGAIRVECAHDTWTAVLAPASNRGQEQ
jgi:hypothetical protein